MDDLRTTRSTGTRLHPLRSLMILLGFVLIGMSLGGLLAMVVLFAAAAAQGEDAILNATEMMTRPELFEGSWYTLMLVQAVSHAFTFLVPCLLFWRMVERNRWKGFNARPLSAVQSVGLVALLTIAFMPFNGLVIDWNQGLELPGFLEPMERWMKDKEQQLGKLTTYLTTFSSPLQFIIALFVIAVLPAIGEEVLFRGIVQRKLIEWTANVHVGIWVAAVIFSAIHMQFYGFVPRVLLGALFGYVYIWSRNIWIPILAHFVNNGFTVLMVWLYRQKVVPVDIEKYKFSSANGSVFFATFNDWILVLLPPK